MRVMALLLVLSASALACTKETGPIGHILLPGHRGTEFKITPDGLSNERVSISRVDKTNTFRGVSDTSFGYKEIEFRLEGEEVHGERAGQPILITLDVQG